jgi:protein-tyrosine phosphatase
MIYFSGNPLLFRKRNGRMEDAVLVLLAPYLIGAWLNSRCWTRKHPEPSQIVSGLWLSRLPSRSIIKRFKPLALIDCCAELPFTSYRQRIHAVPMLDLLAPEVEQIEQGVTAINATRKLGNTMVFCALGYSRSAVIVIASLIEKKYATNIDAAIEIVRKAHPKLVLSAAHRAKLEQWYAQKNDNHPLYLKNTLTDADVTRATSTALLGSIGKTLNAWSMLFALAVILILGLTQGNIFLAVSLLLAVLQSYFAARCAFDAAVFTALGGEALHYQSFDKILTRWKLRSASTVNRSLDERLKGAMRLLRWQAVSFFVQLLLLAVGLMM